MESAFHTIPSSNNNNNNEQINVFVWLKETMLDYGKLTCTKKPNWPQSPVRNVHLSKQTRLEMAETVSI